MCAFQANDGSRWTNASAMKRQNDKMASATPIDGVKISGRKLGDGVQPVKKFSTPEAPRAATAKPVKDDSQQALDDPSQIVGTHGPAQRLTIDSSSGDTHSVESTHPDGHVFRTARKSAEDAHAAARQLAGIGDSDQQELPNLSEAML